MDRVERRFAKCQNTSAEHQEEISENHNELDITSIACEITNFDIYKLRKIWWSVSFADALIVFREKQIKEQREKKERFKTDMFRTDLILKTLGVDLKLTDMIQNDGKPVEKTDAEKEALHIRAGAKIIKD